MRLPLAMAALGAGLLHLALAAGADLSFQIAFAVCGVAELVWAGFAIARHPLPQTQSHPPAEALPLARAIPSLALVPIGVWLIALLSPATTPGTLPLPAIAVASLLDLGVAIGAAVLLRSRPAARRQSAHGEGFTVPLVIGAFAMTAIVLPALGSTAAGSAASAGSHATHQQSELLQLPVDHTDPADH